MKRLICAALIVFSLAGCSSELEVISDCRPERGIRPICGFQNPEDLALLDDGQTLLVSQYGAMDGSLPGNLALFDIGSESLRVAFSPASGLTTGAAAEPGWGDAGCPGPPDAAFSPHGIDLIERPDGRLQLLVVNHGGREAVEFFEITGGGAALGIEWRGCALPPEGAYFNDVVGLPDGGFLVSHMMDRDSGMVGMIKTILGLDTGWVYEWQADTGYQVVPGTEGSMPNGIEVSADAREIFLNLYGSGEVRRISRRTGELLGSAEIPRPDNLTWNPDGRLLVASHTAPIRDLMACMESSAEGSCPFAFEIVSLDPESMSGEPVFSNEGPPMGAGTVAVQLGDELFIGTFSGDRIARVQL